MNYNNTFESFFSTQVIGLLSKKDISYLEQDIISWVDYTQESLSVQSYFVINEWLKIYWDKCMLGGVLDLNTSLGLFISLDKIECLMTVEKKLCTNKKKFDVFVNALDCCKQIVQEQKIYSWKTQTSLHATNKYFLSLNTMSYQETYKNIYLCIKLFFELLLTIDTKNKFEIIDTISIIDSKLENFIFSYNCYKNRNATEKFKYDLKARFSPPIYEDLISWGYEKRLKESFKIK